MSAQKLNRGIIPLFILIAVGVAILSAGGIYIIRQNFVKTGKSGKAALDEEKIKQQIANPTPFPTPTPETTPQLAPTVFTYQPQNTKTKDENAIEPTFTINPPSGWRKSNFENSKAAFESPDKDGEAAEDNLTMTMPANIQIYVELLTNYDTFKNKGYSESQILDELIKSIKSKFLDPYKPKYIRNEKTTFAGQEAYVIEATVTNQYEAQEHVLQYIMIKNKHAVTISGHSLDSTWSKRSGAINASLASFTLK